MSSVARSSSKVSGTVQSTAQSVGRKLQEVAEMRSVAPWVAKMGRFGLVSKGVVYTVLGMLAISMAVGAEDNVDGTKEAVQEIGQLPMGRVILGILAIGLLSYVAWRAIQGLLDPEGEGSDAKGLAKRIGYLCSAVGYSALAVTAGAIAVTGTSSQSGQSQGGGLKTQLLHEPWGRWALGIVGLIVIGTGIAFAVKAYKASFMKKYDPTEMTPNIYEAARKAGRLGYATRAVAFAIIGGFIVQSAYRGSGGEIAGMGDAFAAVLSQTYGQILLVIVAIGLVCYGLHCGLLGCYRKFRINEDCSAVC